jgi:formiminotetrahydrofolate cyclodeaminase
VSAELAGQTLGELLESFAQRTPAPGGGSASAVACALAASLLEMATRFDPAGDQAVLMRAAQARSQALELARRDLEAYLPVLQALRLPRSDPGRAEAVAVASAQASETPLAVAVLAADLAELAARAALDGNPNLDGDASAAVALADGACAAAARLVEINLRDAPQDPRIAAARELTQRAGAARALALTRREVD